MKAEHNDGIYPPKVLITPAQMKEKSEPNVRVTFSNLKEKDDLDMDVTLLSGTL
jgi:hypothetical protein